MDFNFFDRKDQREKQKAQMVKNHSMAKEKAQQSIAALKIQKFFRKHIFVSVFCKSKLNDLESKLNDIKKALSIERIRAKFYMPLEKFIMLLRDLCIGTKVVFKDLANRNQQIRENTEAHFLKIIKGIRELFDCGYNFYNASVIIANIVFNYLIGNVKAKNVLNILFTQFNKFAEKLSIDHPINQEIQSIIIRFFDEDLLKKMAEQG